MGVRHKDRSIFPSSASEFSEVSETFNIAKNCGSLANLQSKGNNRKGVEAAHPFAVLHPALHVAVTVPKGGLVLSRAEPMLERGVEEFDPLNVHYTTPTCHQLSPCMVMQTQKCVRSVLGSDRF